MDIDSSVKFYNEDYLQVNKFKLCLYILLFLIARTGYLGDSIGNTLMLACICIVILQNKVDAFYSLFFSMFISDSMAIMSVVSFPAIVSIIVVCKLLKNKEYSENFKIIILLLLVSQGISTIFYDNTPINAIKAVVSLLLFYLISNERDIFVQETLVKLGALSIISGCVIGWLFYPPDYWQRFSGVWNDENFAGMYCLMGVVFSIFWFKKENFMYRVFILLGTLIILWTATATWSRSFIFISSALFIMFVYYFLKDTRIAIYKKSLLLPLIFGIGFAIAYYSFNIIVEQRGIISENNTDWSSGRLSLMLTSIELFFRNPLFLLTGWGLSNNTSVYNSFGLHGMASHNAYVDFLVQYGVIMFVLFSYIMIYYYYNTIRIDNLKNVYFWACTIFLLYATCLTLTQYIIGYVLFGLLALNLKSCITNI